MKEEIAIITVTLTLYFRHIEEVKKKVSKIIICIKKINKCVH